MGICEHGKEDGRKRSKHVGGLPRVVCYCI